MWRSGTEEGSDLPKSSPPVPSRPRWLTDTGGLEDENVHIRSAILGNLVLLTLGYKTGFISSYFSLEMSMSSARRQRKAANCRKVHVPASEREASLRNRPFLSCLLSLSLRAKPLL